MTRPWWDRAAILAAVVVASPLNAQDLARRVTSADGSVNVVYPSRPGVCGDGRTLIGNVLGEGQFFTLGDSWSDNERQRACVQGPARALVTVLDGEVTRIRSFVGPVPTLPADSRTISASGREAADWLSTIALRGSSRVAADAVMSLVLADAPDPWPLLLRIARDDERPRTVRSSALLWLSNAVTDHLGIAKAKTRESDDDEVREQAVFALSQRPKSESVPELIEIVRLAKNPAARRSAIFWLGQTGDRRAADVFAELLGAR